MRLAAGCLVLVCAACASQPERRDVAPASNTPDVRLGGGQWLLPGHVQESQHKESHALAVHSFELEDVEGSPSVRVLGVEEPESLTAPRDGVAYFKTLLDEDVAAECIVRSDRLEVAQTFHQVLAEIERRPALHMRHMGQVQRMDAGGWPVVSVSVEYLTPSRQYGTVHMAATNVHDHGVFCSVDAPGYARSFQRLMAELVGSLRGAVPDGSVRRTFHWLHAGGGWSGLVENVERVRQDGMHVDIHFAALLQQEPMHLLGVDEVNMEITRPDGGLVMVRSLRQEEGAVSRDLTLTPNASHHTVLRGLASSPEEQDLGAMVPVTSRGMREFYLAARQGGEKERVFVRYYPGMDATGLAEERVEALGIQGGHAMFRSTITTQKSQVEGRYEVDEEGEVVDSTIAWEGGSLGMEHVKVAPLMEAAFNP